MTFDVAAPAYSKTSLVSGPYAPTKQPWRDWRNFSTSIPNNLEAKALGIPMGAPYFKIEREFLRQGGIALSSNYALYADMSNRVMSILAGFSPQQEVYSIDECFLGMSGFRGLTAIGQDIRRKLRQWTGLPVCVGFGLSLFASMAPPVFGLMAPLCMPDFGARTGCKNAGFSAFWQPRFRAVFERFLCRLMVQAQRIREA